MAKETSKNIRLGMMVLAGTAFMIIAMYVIGDKQNLFGSTFQISAYFKNVNGLMVGNNVRFVGIDVGTVNNIEIINDTTVKVDMAIESESQKFIKKNAVAAIGTDGLMGNKLVNINPAKGISKQVEEGDILKTSQPLETDLALRTLTQTNEDIAVIANNLRIFTETLNDPNSLWSVLTDSATANNIKDAIVNIRITSTYSAIITGELASLVADIRAGKGTFGELLTDTTFVTGLNQTMANIQIVSDSLVYFSGDLRAISDLILDSEGAFQTVMSDSTFNDNLSETMISIRRASEGLDENMEAVKHSILFRRYYRKKARELEKERKALD